ncbi:prostaglandin D2 receptor 2 [Lampris incognitus]|uniref:prostaglandin D2 receptor 2 n=1 Tax=Lampris incognitus TaxID=2546036 RepID=UPI0024B5EE71|nr:prostaglandin D2 receptor 2 [Lampris incognitus]
MSNITFPFNHSAEKQLLCPLLQAMWEHSVNGNAKANLLVVCIQGLVSCLGILENALILWVVGFRLRRRTVASVWVLNLALSDFLATLTLPLFTHYLHSSHSWELGRPLCAAQASIFFLNMFVSAFLLAAISLDRYLLVAKPVWSNNHRSVSAAWKVCALGWLWAAVNTFPYFLFRDVIVKKNGNKLCYHNFALFLSSQAMLDRNCEVRQTATAISKLLLAFLIPLLVIAGSYIQLVISLRRRTGRKKESTNRLTGALIVTNTDRASKTTKTSKTAKSMNTLFKPEAPTPASSSNNQTSQGLLSKNFTKMVTSVIAAFVLCWAPYHIFCLIEVGAQYWPQKLVLVEVWLPRATTFAFFNPLLNPILYAFSCPHFCVRIRQSLAAVFEGLVEEGGGLISVPGRSRRAQPRCELGSCSNIPKLSSITPPVIPHAGPCDPTLNIAP